MKPSSVVNLAILNLRAYQHILHEARVRGEDRQTLTRYETGVLIALSFLWEAQKDHEYEKATR